MPRCCCPLGNLLLLLLLLLLLPMPMEHQRAGQQCRSPTPGPLGKNARAACSSPCGVLLRLHAMPAGMQAAQSMRAALVIRMPPPSSPPLGGGTRATCTAVPCHAADAAAPTRSCLCKAKIAPQAQRPGVQPPATPAQNGGQAAASTGHSAQSREFSGTGVTTRVCGPLVQAALLGPLFAPPPLRCLRAAGPCPEQAAPAPRGGAQAMPRPGSHRHMPSAPPAIHAPTPKPHPKTDSQAAPVVQHSAPAPQARCRSLLLSARKQPT
jgi:hypothetical protein